MAFFFFFYFYLLSKKDIYTSVERLLKPHHADSLLGTHMLSGSILYSSGHPDYPYPPYFPFLYSLSCSGQ